MFTKLQLLICLMLLPFTTHAAIVAGGDFESPVVGGTTFLLSVSPDGWNGTGDLVGQGYAGAVNSGSGNQWLDLNPGTAAGTGISQSISLVAGTAYTFSFLYNGGGGGSTTSIAYSVDWGVGTPWDGSVSTAGMDVYGGTPWEIESATFTASITGDATLSFLPNGSWSGGFIDAVNISPIPLPAAAWLFGSALLGLAAVKRKKA